MTLKLKNNHDAWAVVRFLQISPNKIKRILNCIRTKPYHEALIILEFMPYKPCLIIWRILNNAIANLAKKLKFSNKNLIIKHASVNKGPIKKFIKYNARGQSSILKRRTSHISIAVSIF